MAAPERHQPDRRLRRRIPANRKYRRLGRLEWSLFAVIALCIAITLVLAIVNPSG